MNLSPVLRKALEAQAISTEKTQHVTSETAQSLQAMAPASYSMSDTAALPPDAMMAQVITFTERNCANGHNFETQRELAHCLRSLGDGGRTECHPVIGTFGVRRLTPTECERLQGFPDGWTEGQSDTARYRQLGNAVTVPVVEWIAGRLMVV